MTDRWFTYNPADAFDVARAAEHEAAARAAGYTQVEHVPMTALHLVKPLPPLPETLSPGEVGLDISHWNTVTDWAKVRAARVRFVYVKRTQGISIVDAKGSTHWRAAQNAVLWVGGYHFFEWDKDGGQQALHFLATLGEDVGSLTPAVDVEPDGQPNPNIDKVISTANLKKFLDTLETRGLRPAVIYTSAGAWAAMTTLPMWAVNYPLWAADWNAPLNLPMGWTFARFWQQGKRLVDGVSGEVDFNVFQGFSASPPPPSLPDPLYQARVNYTLNVRNSMGALDGAQKVAGDVVDVWKEHQTIGGFVNRSVIDTAGNNVWDGTGDPRGPSLTRIVIPPPVAEPQPVVTTPPPDTILPLQNRGLRVDTFVIENTSVAVGENCWFRFFVVNKQPQGQPLTVAVLGAYADDGAFAPSFTHFPIVPDGVIDHRDHISFSTPGTKQVRLGVKWSDNDTAFVPLSALVTVTVR